MAKAVAFAKTPPELTKTGNKATQKSAPLWTVSNSVKYDLWKTEPVKLYKIC